MEELTALPVISSVAYYSSKLILFISYIIQSEYCHVMHNLMYIYNLICYYGVIVFFVDCCVLLHMLLALWKNVM